MRPRRCQPSIMSARRPRPAEGFTLVELMAVVAVLSLLAAMLLPYLSQTYAAVHSTRCKNNLKSLAQAMHGNTVDRPLMLPGAADWVPHALTYSSPESLLCLEDHDVMERQASHGDIENIYILQYHHDGKVTASYLEDILAGRPVEDFQVHMDKWVGHCAHGQQCNCCWHPDELEDNQHVVGVEASVCLKVTLGATITIEMLDSCLGSGDPRNPDTSVSSEHFLKRGPANPPEADGELLYLKGKSNYEVDDRSPVRLSGVPTSYGMSASIHPRGWRPEQILLMDANEVVVSTELDDQANDLDPLAPRHFGKVNAVTVGQSVRSYTVLELEEMLERDAWREAQR